MKTTVAVGTMLCAVAAVLRFGMISGFAQTGQYLYTGSETTITLNSGTYDITAYGAQGGAGYEGPSENGPPLTNPGGLGAEMEGEFNFTTATILTLLVGGVGEEYVQAGGGGGGSFVANGSTPLVVAGGGGGGGYSSGGNGGNGLVGTSGAAGSNSGPIEGPPANGGAGGTGGNGGGGAGGLFWGGSGGGGFYGSGGNGSYYYGGTGGVSYVSGGAGGTPVGGYGGGGGGGYSGGGGGGYSGGGGGAILGGGGGGSIIDSSAITNLVEISGVASPDDSPNGEIIITAVPEPSTWAMVALGIGIVLGGLRLRRRSS